MAAASSLWQDVLEVPRALRATLAASDGWDEAARLLGDPGVRRIVATGNGASYYVALALWLASLGGPHETSAGRRRVPDVVAVPGGLVARGRFAWRSGDALLAISTSGSFRDVVEAVEVGAPRPFALVTSTPDSVLGRTAGTIARVRTLHQRAVTHTQALCGNLVAALGVWARITGDTVLAAALDASPDAVAGVLPRAPAFAAELPLSSSWPRAVVAFGSGPAWAAALELALLFKEVAGLPAEGLETREGATSAMYALGPDDLVLSLPAGDHDQLLDEAEAVCRAQGARVARLPGADGFDARLAIATTLPAAVALAERSGLARGLDVDTPAWLAAYESTARPR